MKKLALVLVVVLLASMVAMAQDEKVQVFGGWQYTNLDLKKSDSGIDRQSAPKGWDADVAFKVSNNVSFVGDISGAYKEITVSGVSTGVNAHVHNFLFGPRFSATSGKVSPFFEALVGVNRSSLGISGLSVASVSSTGLAFAVGGGLDVTASKHVALRLAKFDYVLNRADFGSTALDISTGSMSLNHFRVASGVVFKF